MSTFFRKVEEAHPEMEATAGAKEVWKGVKDWLQGVSDKWLHGDVDFAKEELAEESKMLKTALDKMKSAKDKARKARKGSRAEIKAKESLSHWSNQVSRHKDLVKFYKSAIKLGGVRQAIEAEKGVKSKEKKADLSTHAGRLAHSYPQLVQQRTAKHGWAARETLTLEGLTGLCRHCDEDDIATAFDILEEAYNHKSAYKALRKAHRELGRYGFYGVTEFGGDENDFSVHSNTSGYPAFDAGGLYNGTVIWDGDKFVISTEGDLRDYLERNAGASDGWGPASDGLNYSVSFAKPQASNYNTGPWVTGSIRGRRGSGFAVRQERRQYDRVVKRIRREAGRDFNEANKMMYDYFSSLPTAEPYDPYTHEGPWSNRNASGIKLPQ